MPLGFLLACLEDEQAADGCLKQIHVNKRRLLVTGGGRISAYGVLNAGEVWGWGGVANGCVKKEDCVPAL